MTKGWRRIVLAMVGTLALPRRHWRRRIRQRIPSRRHRPGPVEFAPGDQRSTRRPTRSPPASTAISCAGK